MKHSLVQKLYHKLSRVFVVVSRFVSSSFQAVVALMVILALSAALTPFAHAATNIDLQLAQVTITNQDGTLMIGAPVQIRVVPQKGSTGPQVIEPLAGEGRTDTSGHVIVAITPPAITDSTLVSPKGFVNYELMIVRINGALLVDHYFTRYYGNDPNLARESSVFPQYLRANQVGSTGPDRGGQNCFWAAPIQSWVQWTVIGELHTVTGLIGKFTYGQTANTNVSVGETFNGGQSWSGSGNGTLNAGNSLGATVGITEQLNGTWGHQLQSQFTYVKENWYCVPGGPTSTYRVIVSQWDGGFQIGNDESSFDNRRNQYWNSYPPNTSFSRSSNTLYTYGFGVTLGFVTLSAQSGASVNVVLSWNNTGSSTRYLYGNNGYPPYSLLIYASLS